MTLVVCHCERIQKKTSEKPEFWDLQASEGTNKWPPKRILSQNQTKPNKKLSQAIIKATDLLSAHQWSGDDCMGLHSAKQQWSAWKHPLKLPALLSGLLSLLGSRTRSVIALLLFGAEHVHRTQRQLRLLLSNGDFLTKIQKWDKSAYCTQRDPFFLPQKKQLAVSLHLI